MHHSTQRAIYWCALERPKSGSLTVPSEEGIPKKIRLRRQVPAIRPCWKMSSVG